MSKHIVVSHANELKMKYWERWAEIFISKFLNNKNVAYIYYTNNFTGDRAIFKIAMQMQNR